MFRGGKMGLITNILFPVDFSSSCIAMAFYVKRAAALSGAGVSLIHVFEPASYSGFELYLRRPPRLQKNTKTSLNIQKSSLPGIQRHKSLRPPGAGSISSSCRRMRVLFGGCYLALRRPRCSMMQIAQS
jgi:hypothetical protein